MILDDEYITKDMLTKESYQGNNYAAHSGLRELFNIGISNC